MKRKIIFFVLVSLNVLMDDRNFYGLKIKIRAFRSSADTTGGPDSFWEFNRN